MLRLKIKCNVRAWEEVEEKNVLFAPDDALSEETIDNMLHVSSGRLTVADTANMDIPIPEFVTICGVQFKSDQDVDVKLNGGSSVYHLKRPSVGTDDFPTYCTFFFEGSLTEINITKPHTDLPTDANIRWVVWGDPETF